MLPRNQVWRNYIALTAFVLPVAVIACYLIGGKALAIASLISGVVIMAAVGLRIRRFAGRNAEGITNGGRGG